LFGIQVEHNGTEKCLLASPVEGEIINAFALDNGPHSLSYHVTEVKELDLRRLDLE
jgi:hypothetical protein